MANYSAPGTALPDSTISLLGVFTSGPVSLVLQLESFEPSFMIFNFDKLKEVLASRKIPVFYASLQRRSNRILKLMKRQYCVEDFCKVGLILY